MGNYKPNYKKGWKAYNKLNLLIYFIGQMPTNVLPRYLLATNTESARTILEVFPVIVTLVLLEMVSFVTVSAQSFQISFKFCSVLLRFDGVSLYPALPHWNAQNIAKLSSMNWNRIVTSSRWIDLVQQLRTLCLIKDCCSFNKAIHYFVKKIFEQELFCQTYSWL